MHARDFESPASAGAHGRMRVLDAKPVNLDGFSVTNPELGLVAMRVGKKLSWDAKAMKCSNAPEADRFLKESYRAGWELPA